MNRVTLTMSLVDWESIMDPKWKEAKEVQDLLREIIKKEPDGKSQGSVGRPLQANHPHHTQEELKKYRDILFSDYRIQNDSDWEYDGKKPSRLAAYQDDMEVYELRLDNGQVACVDLVLDGLPAAPKYKEPPKSWQF